MAEPETLADRLKRGVGERIKKVRERDGLNQKEFAEKLGIRNATVSNWETGKVFPHYEQLIEISIKMGCAFYYLVSGQGSPARVKTPFEVASIEGVPLKVAPWQQRETQRGGRLEFPVVMPFPTDEHDYVCVAEDKAMEPYILQGDILVYRDIAHDSPTPGDFVWARVKSTGRHLLRRLREVSDRARPGVDWELLPLHSDFVVVEQSPDIELVGIVSVFGLRKLRPMT